MGRIGESNIPLGFSDAHTLVPGVPFLFNQGDIILNPGIYYIALEKPMGGGFTMNYAGVTSYMSSTGYGSFKPYFDSPVGAYIDRGLNYELIGEAVP